MWLARSTLFARMIACLALLSLAVYGCGETETPTPAETSTPSDDAPARGEPTLPLPERLLTGRLIVLSATGSDQGEVAWQVDPVSGETAQLWQEDGDTAIAGWRVAPDGRRAAYLSTSTGSDGRVELVVRQLQADAAPVPAWQAGEAQARPAGFAWSPDSASLVIGQLASENALVEARGETGGRVAEDASGDEPAESTRGRAPRDGSPSSPGSGSSPMELRRIAIGEAMSGDGGEPANSSLPTEVVCTLEATSSTYAPGRLVQWSPASGRAAVLEPSPDGGIASAVALFDSSSGALFERLPVDLAMEDVVPSFDRERVAVAVSGAEPRVGVIELASGEIRDLAHSAEGWVPANPVWSPDGEWLAWTESARALSTWEGTTSRVRAVPLTGAIDEAGHPGLTITMDGQETRAVAFSPDSHLLLVAEAELFVPEPYRLSVYELDTRDGGPLPWPLPAGTWHIDWVP